LCIALETLPGKAALGQNTCCLVHTLFTFFLNPNLIAANLIAAKAPFSRVPPSGQGWVGWDWWVVARGLVTWVQGHPALKGTHIVKYTWEWSGRTQNRISTTVNNSEALVSHQQLLNFYCQSSKPDIVRSPSYPVTSKFYQESLIKVIPLDAFLICEQLRWGALDLQVCQSSEVDTWKNLFLVAPKGFQVAWLSRGLNRPNLYDLHWARNFQYGLFNQLRLSVVPLQHAMLKRLPDRQSVGWLRTGELLMAPNGFISFTVGCFSCQRCTGTVVQTGSDWYRVKLSLMSKVSRNMPLNGCGPTSMGILGLDVAEMAWHLDELAPGSRMKTVLCAHLSSFILLLEIIWYRLISFKIIFDPNAQNLGKSPILGDGHQSMSRDFHTHCRDSHCGMDDHGALKEHPPEIPSNVREGTGLNSHLMSKNV